MTTIYEMNKNIIEKTTKAFIVGDALGAPFEFGSPTLKDMELRFYGSDSIVFTDDSYLALSTIESLKIAARSYSCPEIFWEYMRVTTCKFLIEWFNGGDFRGIGNTTLLAIKQMWRSEWNGGELDKFKIDPRRAYLFDMSAGNGILSRVLPLAIAGLGLTDEMKSWLELTHLHPEGIAAVGDLIKWVNDNTYNLKVYDSPKGFFAPETLYIATQAVKKSNDLYEVFVNSQVREGDNDSTAALAFALWFLNDDEEEDELERHWKRLNEKDRHYVNSIVSGSN